MGCPVSSFLFPKSAIPGLLLLLLLALGDVNPTREEHRVSGNITVRPEGQWKDITDPELFEYISILEEEEYKSRFVIDPAKVGTTSGCRGSTVCGVFVDQENMASCMDLCTETRFLPLRYAGLRDDTEASAAQELQAALWARQFGEEMDPVKLRSASSPMSGFGVTMVYAAHNLAKAFASGNIFAPSRDSLSLWTSERYCGENRSLSCYFDPPTNHTLHILDSQGRRLTLNAEREQAIAGIDGIMHDFSAAAYQQLGSFWFQAQMLNFIWRPNFRTRQYIDSLKAQVKLEHPIIGLHVRRGDSFMAGRWMPTLETYLQEARKLRELYGVDRIFIATDDEDSAKQCLESSEFQCSSLPIGRSIYDVGAKAAPVHNPKESAYEQWVEKRIERGEVDGSEAALHVIAEIETLSECDMFVGRLDSAISRLAVMLMTSKHGPRPFVSLDKPWAQPPHAIIN